MIHLQGGNRTGALRSQSSPGNKACSKKFLVRIVKKDHETAAISDLFPVWPAVMYRGGLHFPTWKVCK